LFEQGVGYRQIDPNDRVSKTVGYAHTAVLNSTEHGDAREFFASLFPDLEMANYMLRILAAALFNAPIEEFYLLVGDGSNGKKML
jgi:phage/plasmid-associated DNA primase